MMPRGVLHFRLPQERGEFRLAVKATEWALVVYSLREWLFNQIDEVLPSHGDQGAWTQQILDHLDGLIERYGVDLGDVE
jgi:hypothetical protein